MTGQHVLLVGDTADLPEIRTMLAGLPLDAYGQVYIEVTSLVQAFDLIAPAGVNVTWLARERPGGVIPRGELAAHVISAWMDEWMPHESDPEHISFVLWIGCAANGRVDRLYRSIRDRL